MEREISFGKYYFELWRVLYLNQQQWFHSNNKEEEKNKTKHKCEKNILGTYFISLVGQPECAAAVT